MADDHFTDDQLDQQAEFMAALLSSQCCSKSIASFCTVVPDTMISRTQ